MDLFYPIILISSLIFVHELGHFLFAKAFGVKVLTFSLGFGPKVLRLRGRETEYCVSLIPLGGYVRMLEAAKSDVVLPEDRKRTFESLPLYKRIVIVLAGPAMNLVFPVLLYFAVFVGDGPFLPPTVGVVLPGHPADGKLMPGDRIMSVNGEEVATFDEVEAHHRQEPGRAACTSRCSATIATSTSKSRVKKRSSGASSTSPSAWAAWASQPARRRP